MIVTVALFSLVLRCLFATLAYWETVDNFDTISHPLLFVEQDSTIYPIIALNLMQGNGYTSLYTGDPSTSSLFRQHPLYVFWLYPLYEFFGLSNADISVLHPENEAARRIFTDHIPVVLTAVALNHFLGILTILCVVVIVYYISESSLHSLVAGLLFSSSVVKMVADNAMLPDCLQVFFVTAALLSFLNFSRNNTAYGWLFLSALCLDLGAITKPAGMFLWVFFIISIAVFTQLNIRKKVVLCLLYFVIANFGPACWLVRNGMLTGTYKYTSQGDYLVLNHWANRTLQVKSGLSYVEYIYSETPRNLENRAAERINRDEVERGYTLNQAERDGHYRAVGLEVILNNWPWYLKAHIMGFAEEILRAPAHRSRWLEFALMGICLIGVTGSVWITIREKRYASIFLLLAPLLYYFAIIPPAPPGNLRYKVLWLPFLFILAFSAKLDKGSNASKGCD